MENSTKNGGQTSSTDDQQSGQGHATITNVESIKDAAAKVGDQTNVKQPETENIAEIAAEEDRKGRGIRIFLKDGVTSAIVPRNCNKFLRAATEQGIADLTRKEYSQFANRSDIDPNRLFTIGPNLPEAAFPGKTSANTIAQSVKKNLENKGVIEVLQPGTPSTPALFILKVDKWEAKPEVENTPDARSTGKRGGRKANAVSKGRKKSVRNTTQHASAPSTRSNRESNSGREALLSAFPISNYGEAKEADAFMDMVARDNPKMYKFLLNLKIAA